MVPEKDNGLELLHCFARVAPYINQLAPEDTAVAVATREKYLAYVPGQKIDHGVRAGQPVKEGSMIHQAITGGKRIVKKMDSSVFGFPYIGIAMPIFHGGGVVGAVGFFESTEKRDMVAEMAGELQKVIGSVSQYLQEAYGGIQELASLSQILKSSLAISAEKFAETRKILALVKEIADSTNMLGLIAAIEAAHAGEYGRGFGVVAKEIRRLAGESNKSVKFIGNLLEELKKHLEEVSERAKI